MLFSSHFVLHSIDSRAAGASGAPARGCREPQTSAGHSRELGGWSCADRAHGQVDLRSWQTPSRRRELSANSTANGAQGPGANPRGSGRLQGCYGGRRCRGAPAGQLEALAREAVWHGGYMIFGSRRRPSAELSEASCRGRTLLSQRKRPSHTTCGCCRRLAQTVWLFGCRDWSLGCHTLRRLPEPHQAALSTRLRRGRDGRARARADPPGHPAHGARLDVDRARRRALGRPAHPLQADVNTTARARAVHLQQRAVMAADDAALPCGDCNILASVQADNLYVAATRHRRSAPCRAAAGGARRGPASAAPPCARRKKLRPRAIPR